jgi:hypothetical protein
MPFFSSTIHFTLTMEAAFSSKMLVSCCNTMPKHHDPEDLDLNLHHHENLTSHILLMIHTYVWPSQSRATDPTSQYNITSSDFSHSFTSDFKTALDSE